MKSLLSLLLWSPFLAALKVVEGAAFVSYQHATTHVDQHPFSTTNLHSIPNSLDTLTSGLASICRLPKGVTALETPPTPDGKLDLLPRFTQLWDIENSVDCREVRELLTELDVTVDQIIPAAPNSRVFLDRDYEYHLDAGTPVPRLAVYQANGEEFIVSGKDQIVAYLEDLKQQQVKLAKATSSYNSDGEESSLNEQAQQALAVVQKVWNIVGNNLASTLRLGRGKEVCSAASCTIPVPVRRPYKPLVLYSYEGNQFCRLVREVLTELDVIYELRSAGKESPRRSELSYITGGSSQCPYLIDPNTGADMAESADIIAYLYKNYARWTPPNELLQWASGSVMPLLKPVFQATAPLQAGSSKTTQSKESDAFQDDIQQAQQTIDQAIQQHPVVVYTYEWSPFCTEATNLLDRLEIRYHQVSLGKEWIPGLITEEGAQIRAALLERTGQSSLPHIFVGGKSIGGLFSGSPGLIAALEKGKLDAMVEAATEILQKRKELENKDSVLGDTRGGGGGGSGAFE